MFVRTNTWTVHLQPADGMPDEYAGMAERDEPGADGRPVNLTFGAVLIKGRLKAWLGPGIIVCEAPFRTRTEMVGTCNVVLAEGETGPFRARRLP